MKGDGLVLSNQNDTHISLMLFYCLKVHIGEEEVKHWQNFVYYVMDCLLQTFSHIGIRLIKWLTSSNPRVTSSNPQVTSSNPWVKVQIYKSRVQIHELRVSIQKLRVQTYELQVQIHEFGDLKHELED